MLTPAFETARVKVFAGDCRSVLQGIETASIHCCVTSPPYWGLRDYGTATWEGGDEGCDHRKPPNGSDPARGSGLQGGKSTVGHTQESWGDVCHKCGARRIDAQLGLEATYQEYVQHMVEVFRAVRSVLRDDGTLWLNLGDSYCGSGGYSPTSPSNLAGSKQTTVGGECKVARATPRVDGLKPKDLVGIPWRVAFALQEDGWVLRQEIIWAKPNPMPESVRDRCTKSHEQIFLFAKAKWSGPQPGRFAHISDADARWLALCIDTEGCIVIKRVKQNDGGADSFSPQVSFGSTSVELMERFSSIVGYGTVHERPGKNAPMWYWQVGNKVARDFLKRIYPYLIVKQRQARIGIYVDDLLYYRGGKFLSRKQRTTAENDQLISLWSRCKECNRFGHPDLSDVPEPAIGRWAGCQRYYYDAEAICEPIATASNAQSRGDKSTPDRGPKDGGNSGLHAMAIRMRDGIATNRNKRSVWTVTTKPYKGAHFATFPPDLIEPCIRAGCPPSGVVLDPFHGSGTTGQVAIAHGCDYIGIELNPEYIEMSKARFAQPRLF